MSYNHNIETNRISLDGGICMEKNWFEVLESLQSYMVDSNEMNNIATYMNDDIRERVHFELVPCSNKEFLIRYIQYDPNFEAILKTEFGIEL